MSANWEVPEIKEALRSQYEAGLSHSVIARNLNETFNLGVTRNAVIGKCTRLGLTHRERKTLLKESPQDNPKSERKKRYQHRFTDRVAPLHQGDLLEYKRQLALAYEPEINDALDIPREHRKTLFELTEHSCRWPYGEPGRPDFFFCGDEAVEDKPYCQTHCRAAYMPKIVKA